MNHRLNTQNAPKVLQPQVGIPKKTYVPIGRALAVHAYPAGETEAGLVLPDGVANPMETGIALVIACGPDVKQVKEGDEILYLHHMQAVVHDKQITGIINEEHVVGVLIADSSRKRGIIKE